MQLRKYLEENGIRHSFIAKKIGTDSSHLCRWLSGDVAPRLEAVVAIEKITNGQVTIHDWIKLSEQKKKRSKNRSKQKKQQTSALSDPEKFPEKPLS